MDRVQCQRQLADEPGQSVHRRLVGHVDVGIGRVAVQFDQSHAVRDQLRQRFR